MIEVLVILLWAIVGYWIGFRLAGYFIDRGEKKSVEQQRSNVDSNR